MVTKKYPWLTAFGVSLVSHALAIVLIGALASLYPSIPKDKGPLQVDLVSLAGGGGGGEEAETSDEPEESQDNEEDYNPPVPADYEADNEAVNDVHEIANKTQEEQTKEVKKARSHRRSYTGNGSGSGTGSGSGVGSGTGSGEGAGIGNGTGDGTGETIGPQLLYSTTPAYPESARAADEEGTVMVGLTISVSGTVTSAWVENSSGNSTLDQAAVNSVYSWRFAPAKQNGVAIEVQSRVPVSFTLR